MANAKPSGRTLIDWEDAFVYYASLPARQRSYRAVADHFQVSVRTVETHGRSANWKQRLRAIANKAAAEAEHTLVAGRVDELQKLRKLIDASLVSYAERLRRGEMRMSPADLERLNRLSRSLIDEIEHSNQHVDAETRPERTAAHTQAVLDTLAESGALEALGLTTMKRENS